MCWGSSNQICGHLTNVTQGVFFKLYLLRSLVKCFFPPVIELYYFSWLNVTLLPSHIYPDFVNNY